MSWALLANKAVMQENQPQMKNKVGSVCVCVHLCLQDFNLMFFLLLVILQQGAVILSAVTA